MGKKLKELLSKRYFILIPFAVVLLAVVVWMAVLLNAKGNAGENIAANINESPKYIPIVEESREDTSQQESSKEDGEEENDEDEADENEADENEDDEAKNSESEDEDDSSISYGNGVTKRPSSASVSGRLHVEGTHLVDASGNQIQLKGLSTHGIGWFPQYINNECFRQFKQDFGINLIRLAMYTAEYNGYCSGGDKSYLKSLIDDGVEYATNNDMYVIIDWHILSDNNPNINKSEAEDFFDEMSRKYAGYSNVLYEICNEPNGGTSWSSIKNYAQDIIDIIKSNDENAIVIVGTPNWSQYVDQAADNPITGYSNIMYALHFYAATHKDDLRSKMSYAVSQGLPIFVTEFGICDASGNGGIDENEAAKWVSAMDSKGISYAMWNISNKNETSAIINSSCNKKNGFTINDLSASGKWFLKMMMGNLDLPEYNSYIEEDNNTSNNNTYDENNNSNNNSNDNSNANNNYWNNSSNAPKDVEVTSSVTVTNSWESGDKKYYQLSVSVTNNSGEDCGSWKTSITRNADVNVTQGWGGNFSSQGSTIYITSLDWNSYISAGQTIDNIGLIIEE